jgi:hypothetical protein
MIEVGSLSLGRGTEVTLTDLSGWTVTALIVSGIDDMMQSGGIAARFLGVFWEIVQRENDKGVCGERAVEMLRSWD